MEENSQCIKNVKESVSKGQGHLDIWPGPAFCDPTHIIRGTCMIDIVLAKRKRRQKENVLIC